MTPSEATTLIAKMRATWPMEQWSASRIELWKDEFEALDPFVVRQALSRLRRAERACPTIADFLAVYQSLQRAVATPERPTDMATPDQFAAGLAQARAALAEAREQAAWRRRGGWGKQ